LLTGESLPVLKDEEVIFPKETGPGDRLNVCYSSSTVTKGRARGVAFATGMKTEIGSIAKALRQKDSRLRTVKRSPDGTVHPLRHAESWSLSFTDAIGQFLGVNVGTPLQKKLSRLAMLLFGIAIVFAIIVEASNSFSSNKEVIIYAVATGLSMIPASLIVVLTITMAVGTKRMVARNVIVRKMDSLEALGGVTDICSDKTGTLTQGKMVTKRVWIPSKGTYSVASTDQPMNPTFGDLMHTSSSPKLMLAEKQDEGDVRRHSDMLKDNSDLKHFLWTASLANLANVHESKGEWMARGDPTDVAIQVFATRFDMNRTKFTDGEDPAWKQVSEYPFDSDVKKMSVIFEDLKSREQWVCTKGAVERVIENCTRVGREDSEEAVEMTEEFRNEIIEHMEALTSLGLRVLALANRAYNPQNGRRASRVDEPPGRDEVECDLTFRGLIGLFDPPRPESASAVKDCHRAGISVHMLTGDHPGTACAIAAEVGILPEFALVSKDVADSMVMTAKAFDSLSDEQVDKLPVLPLVIARCAPQTKVRMIEALHRRGAFAAMVYFPRTEKLPWPSC
jgi:Na+-exporting ATPase